MNVYDRQRIYTKVLTDIKCNMCGQSCWDRHKMNYELSSLNATWGYNSKKDGTKWEADFCEECSDKLEKFIESNGGSLSKSEYFYGLS